MAPAEPEGLHGTTQPQESTGRYTRIACELPLLRDKPAGGEGEYHAQRDH